jgi:two-component system LytT family sensor kinase
MPLFRTRTSDEGHSPRPVYWITQLGGWGLFVGLFVLWNYLQDSLDPGVMMAMLLVFATGVAMSHLLRHVMLRLGWIKNDLGHVLPRLAFISLVMGLVAYLVYSGLHDLLFPQFPPMVLTTPLDVFAQVMNWTVLFLMWSMAYLVYALVIRHRREEIRLLRLEAADRENQLSNLRAQMNPHFMFNALNGIRALIDEDPGQAKRAITQLSAILRNALTSVKRHVVPLGEEIDMVKAYLALEAMRYEERLRTQIHVPPELEREPVPPMLLQTLVENAVRHGIAKLPNGGDLTITVGREADGHLHITIRNSGSYRPGKSQGTGIGLRNTRTRLEMIYGDQAGLQIGEEDGQVVTLVRLPAGEPLFKDQRA